MNIISTSKSLVLAAGCYAVQQFDKNVCRTKCVVKYSAAEYKYLNM